MRVYVVTGRRQPRWVKNIVALLRARGVACEIVQGLGGTVETWSLEIGEERGGIPAFGDAIRGKQSIEVRLVAHAADGVRRQLRRGCFPYASRHSRTLDRVVEQCVAWIAEELRGRGASSIALDLTKSSRSHIGPVDRVRFAASELSRMTRHVLRYAFEEARWDVAVARGTIENFVADPSANWLHWIARTRGEFLADPFLVESEPGRVRLLCETQHGGVTSLVSIDLDDRGGERTPLLEGVENVSYPYVADIGGEPWLVPEQHRNRYVDAYHLNGNATLAARWNLGGIGIADPTIVKHEGRWWLFCTDQASGPNYALRIFWAEDPQGPWHAHARNPAKVDITGARPAGNFFVRDGMLHRPAQDGSGRYGRAITIQRIDVLTPERFEETCVARIEAPAVGRKGAVGVHTLSHGCGWVAIDAQFVRWSPLRPLRLLRRYLS